MIKSLAVSILLIFACLSTFLNAVEVKDLYLVKLPIAEQSKTARWKASLSGLKEVLVRKSGSQEILRSEEVRQAYRKVTSYLQRFEYSSQTEGSEKDYEISLYFEPRLIDGLIQDSRMPLWGANRPLNIIWLAVEEDFSRRIIVDSSTGQSQSVPDQEKSIDILIQENSLRRGLPVILPLMDLEDELVVSMSDIWGRFPSSIRQASERYAADVVVYGRMSKFGELWQGKFGVINQLDEGAFEVQGESKEKLIAQMMDRLAERLCSKYCVVEEIGIKNEVLIDITDINNFSEYKAALDYLSKLSSVSKVEVVSIEKLNVLFKLTLLGQINSTVEGINLSQKMITHRPQNKNEESLPEQDPKGEELEVSADGVIEINSSLNLATDETAEISGQNEQAFPTDQNSSLDTSIESNSTSESTPVGEQNESDKLQLENNVLQTLFYRWLG
ncbi:MAG: DUF2066 domain-containing protein [Kangiellaceae bacterium]|nr:DUF2066 domain-containing protein [Kangiellaceae bacterium]